MHTDCALIPVLHFLLLRYAVFFSFLILRKQVMIGFLSKASREMHYKLPSYHCIVVNNLNMSH
jgi:hypothetical protein